MKRWLIRLLKLILFVTAILAARSWLQWEMASGEAPPLQGSLIQGGTFSIETPRTQPLVVHFWARWCPVCKLERDIIESLNLDFPVVTVAMQSGTSREVQRYMEKQRMQSPTIVDRDGTLSSNFGVNAVPATFIIDTDNQIRFVERGFTSELGLRARLWLAEKLQSESISYGRIPLFFYGE